MRIIFELFGIGRELTVLQMGMRTVVTFFIGIILIRISGRRSFGMRMPLDNIITLLIGAMLSRAIYGVSPFVPVIVACFVLALTHRLIAWLGVYSHLIGRMVKGESRIIYENEKINRQELNKSLLYDADLEEALRIQANIDTLQRSKPFMLREMAR